MIPDNNHLIPPGLQEAIKKELEATFDEMVKEFFEKFKRRKEEIVAAWAIRVSKMMDVQTMTDKIIIEIRKTDSK